MLHYPEIFLILVVVLIMFGAKKLPELARGLGLRLASPWITANRTLQSGEL
jgi:TatA/E family protein of Tat protein translocase